MMEPSLILIIVILSAALALGLTIIFRKKPASKKDEAASDYADALNLLLVGKREDALKKFREAVTKDSTNIDAYLKIGDLLRELGKIERAINVHKYLTVRSGLTASQQLQIFKSLIVDYQEAKEYDKALSVINKVMDENRGLVWAYESKLKILEQKEEWGKAFQTCKELSKLDATYKNGRLALYKVEEGVQLLKGGQKKDGQGCLKDAIKMAPKIPPAYIYLADSYIKEERKSEALSVLKDFVEKVPSRSFLAFERFKELLYEGGVYGEIENLYLEIIEKQPENLMARLALAENYEKKGEVENAIGTCLNVLEQEPHNTLAKKYLVRLYHKSGKSDEALSISLEIIDESLEQRQKFHCKNCRYESDQPFWRCPQCHEWETAFEN